MPSMIVDYNKYTDGVKSIHASRHYPTIGRHTTSFWKYILYNVFNIAVINSFILYKKNNINLSNSYNYLSYKDDLCDEMMTTYSSWELSDELIPSTIHKLVYSRIRLCVICKKLGRKNKSGNPIRTRYACGLCNINFCKICFADFHSE